MRREWGLLLVLALGCGARTGLLMGSEADPATSIDDGDEGANGGVGDALITGRSGSGSGKAGRSGTGGAGGVSRGGTGGGRSGGGGRGGGGGGGGGVGGGGRGGVAGVGGGAGVGGEAGVGGAPLTTDCLLVGDDPRVAGIKLDEISSLDAADFVRGDVRSYHWTLQPEDCDAVVQDAEITLQGANSRVVKFQPSRPAFYHLTLQVTGVGGDHASCRLEVPVEGVGMRVELCWDTSATTDLDLYLHTPFTQDPWFTPNTGSLGSGLNDSTCNTSNCSAGLRGFDRVDWGYPDSGLSACSTPAFEGFDDVGFCPNPRAADDNNQSIATGTTERMQLDNPGDGETFRVMAQNFSNSAARPHVFVYCGGERAGTFDAPQMPTDFVADSPGTYGVMWRATDITAHVDADGKISCTAVPVGNNALTVDNPTF